MRTLYSVGRRPISSLQLSIDFFHNSLLVLVFLSDHGEKIQTFYHTILVAVVFMFTMLDFHNTLLFLDTFHAWSCLSGV